MSDPHPASFFQRAGRRTRLSALFAGLALLAAACGSGAGTPGFTFVLASAAPSNSPTATSSASPSTAASGATVSLSLKEYSITPAAVTLRAGTPVTFVARNDGTISHALVISGNGVNLTTKDLAFAPGTSESISATLGAGTYMFICPVDGHGAQGMKGTITVTP